MVSWPDKVDEDKDVELVAAWWVDMYGGTGGRPGIEKSKGEIRRLTRETAVNGIAEANEYDWNC